MTGLSVPEITALIIAITGAAGLYVSSKITKRGQKSDEKQQAAANRIQERIAAFDELESLNDRLRSEIDRLRDLLVEAEARGDARLAVQARRCSQRLEEATAALATLQSVVLSEIADRTADEAVESVRKHVAEDHPELD